MSQGVAYVQDRQDIRFYDEFIFAIFYSQSPSKRKNSLQNLKKSGNVQGRRARTSRFLSFKKRPLMLLW
jgi:hypothetical protein